MSNEPIAQQAPFLAQSSAPDQVQKMEWPQWPRGSAPDQAVAPAAAPPPTAAGATAGVGAAPIMDPNTVSEMVLTARREGFTEGQQAAVNELQLNQEATAQVLLTRLAGSIDTVSALSAALLSQARAEVLELAVRLAQHLLTRELEINPAALLELQKDVLEQAIGSTQVTLQVHPQDYETIRAQRDQLVETLAGVAKLTIEPTQEVDRGGCLVVTDNGELDGRIDSRLRSLQQALLASEGEEESK